MDSLKLRQQIEIHIDRLAIGGRGVGRHNGIVVFVEGAAPNEVVRAEITLIKKNFAEGKVLEVIQPSPFRISPLCTYYSKCGGCNWQHLSYTEQLNQKRLLVAEALRKFSGFSHTEVKNPMASPLEWRYRNRIQLHYRPPSELGFNSRNSHQLVPIDDCLIADTKITESFSGIRQRLASSENPVRRFELYLDQNLKVCSTIDSKSRSTGFAQVNQAQNLVLIHAVVEKIRALEPKNIIELYAGAGNFSFPVAKAFQDVKIQAVELHETSVKSAQETVKQLEIENLDFRCSDVADFIQACRPLPATLVLLDPPREGCDSQVISSIVKLQPESLIYISCNPVTLARDLKPFADQYDLIEVQPFDMFPQTDHVEVLTVLKRKTGQKSSRL